MAAYSFGGGLPIRQRGRRQPGPDRRQRRRPGRHRLQGPGAAHGSGPDPAEASDDLLKSSDTFVTVRFNTGDGFTAPVAYNGALPQPLRANATFSRNLGLHFTIAIPIPFTPISIILNPGQYHGRSLGGYDVMLADFDGDGYADHVYSDSSGKIVVQLNNHGRTNLLKAVRRPLGATIELDYARSGNTTDQPGNRWVLAKTTVDDGHRARASTRQVVAYSYAGGKYDRAERDFYGYATVTERQLDPADQATDPDAQSISSYRIDIVLHQGPARARADRRRPGPHVHRDGQSLRDRERRRRRGAAGPGGFHRHALPAPHRHRPALLRGPGEARRRQPTPGKSTAARSSTTRSATSRSTSTPATPAPRTT